MSGFDDATLQRFADLAVGYGCNLQAGQVLNIDAQVGQERGVRALADAAYGRGARFVDPWYFDPRVKHARLVHADDATLDFVPPWYAQRALEQGERRWAGVRLEAPIEPGLFDDIEPARVARDALPWIEERLPVAMARLTNYTIVPFPSPGWASVVHPELRADDALERLTEELAYVCRLDAEDPAASWRRRGEELAAAAERLTALRADALHFEGPGTDLRVGLFPTSRFSPVIFETVDGVRYAANLPSEEILTAPDPERVDGIARATRPLHLHGTTIHGLEVEFRGGRAVRIEADENAEALRAHVQRDAGGARLGEVALVDGSGRVGELGTVFSNTLLDENAASHVALGQAYPFTVGAPDRDRVNTSAIHVDFMIGGPDVSVAAIRPGGARLPVLIGEQWRI